MVSLNYHSFAERLIQQMKLKGFTASRSPNGICIKTLAQFVDASEQICRRYIRGEALPPYEKIVQLAHKLEVSPGWLLFGEEPVQHNELSININLLHYILKKSHELFKEEPRQTDDFADFVIALIRDIREIDTRPDNLQKIINLAVSSISSFKLNQIKKIS